MQRFLCTGNLTKEVEKRQTATGKSVATLSIAVKRPFSDSTDFFNVTVWNAQADNCAKYLKKGSKVAVVGFLQNRSYEANDGTKRTVTEVVAEEVEFLSKVEAKAQVVELEPVQEELPF